MTLMNPGHPDVAMILGSEGQRSRSHDYTKWVGVCSGGGSLSARLSVVMISFTSQNYFRVTCICVYGERYGRKRK